MIVYANRSAGLSVIGKTLGHFHIVDKLGEGGMGEVYRATDARLGRAVALKVISAEMASNPARLDRFRREAKALAALDHPNIVTIFSVEEASGVHFLTMQLVDGQPLDRLIPDGGLPLDRIVQIGTAVAEAVAAAHEKGIVHRDLKPANVMVTGDGRTKVLDFGLAKELWPDSPGDATMTSAGRTELGMVMGTPAYMSPEQVAGRPVDQRTDIFSLGIVLYQMASGRRPFDGASSMELASAVLRDTPTPLNDIRSDLPGDLGRLVRRCLEKDPQQRIQTARDVVNELRDIRSASTSGGREPSRASDVVGSGAGRQDEGFWVGVLPFKYTGPNADVAALADGLSEEIVTGLSRFSYLRVVARSSTSRFANAATDVRTIGREIGARYVLEGSIRQAGSQLRVAVQLVDAGTGAHLWADTYSRAFQPDAIFDLQDDLMPRIVSTVADIHGVLLRSMSDAVRGRRPDQLSAYEAALRGFGYSDRVTVEEHAEVREILEYAVRAAPAASDCWAWLSIVYANEFSNEFNVRPDPLGRALDAARRAVAAAPSSSIAYHALGFALFLKREMDAFRHAAERAVALNPMDCVTMGHMGLLLAYAGDWERGRALFERASELNPQHPGWFWFAAFYSAYRQSDYQAALDAAVRVNLPGYFWNHAVLAAAHAKLGHHDEARAALTELVALRPNIAMTARETFGKYFVDPNVVADFVDGLRRAGLDVPEARARASSTVSGAGTTTLAPEAAAPSIAVLPFANLSADKEQEYFSDGLAEEIINLLAQVPGLKVIARTSAFAFRGKDEDIRKIAQALNVTHVLEGSVRRAGDRIRVTAQLITAADGGHVWSERYDCELRDIFAVQDEISAAITSALRVKLSSGAAPQRYMPKLPAYEMYLKAKHHDAKVTPESMEMARRCYESAIDLDSAFALAHVGLGSYWLGLTIFGQCPSHDAVPAARAACERALQIDSSVPEAHALLGYLAAMYDLDWEAAERHFAFPLAKQAAFPLIRPLYAGFQFLRGSADQAIALAQRAIEEDPLEVWPRMNLHAYLQAAGRDREAYEQTMKVLELDGNLVVACVSVAHFHAHWGQLPEAVAAARQAHAVGPWYPDAVATLAALLRRNGEENESLALYRSIGSGERFGDACAQAIYYLLCGDVDAAADWVERAIQERHHSILFYLRFVVCQALRASNRWPKIARMVNLPAWRDDGHDSPDSRL